MGHWDNHLKVLCSASFLQSRRGCTRLAHEMRAEISPSHGASLHDIRPSWIRHFINNPITCSSRRLIRMMDSLLAPLTPRVVPRAHDTGLNAARPNLRAVNATKHDSDRLRATEVPFSGFGPWFSHHAEQIALITTFLTDHIPNELKPHLLIDSNIRRLLGTLEITLPPLLIRLARHNLK